MSHHITVLAEQPIPRHDEITMEQYYARRLQRRRRVAKRMLARVPLFAAEFMRAEFPDMTPEQVVTDATRPTRKRKSSRTKKNGLKRYGRYPMYIEAMERYRTTGDANALAEAQAVRNRIAKDFLFDMRCQGAQRTYRLPATAPLTLVRKIAALKFQRWEDLDRQWKDLTMFLQW